ncbi:MAG: hypothetical protein WC333_07085 [Dehalococcoidia bacterium]|jgi:hypothetical protein
MRNTKKRRTKRSFNNRIILSFTLTLLILASLMLVNVQPAAAIQVTLSNVPSIMCTDRLHTITAQVIIETGELVPIDDIELTLDGPTPVSAVFTPGGGLISGDTQIESVTFLGTSNYEFGYLNAQYGSYGYSWGYGYGYGTGTITLTYQIAVRATGMTSGDYIAQLSVNVGSDSFLSSEYPFIVRPCGGGGGGGYAPTFSTNLCGTTDYWIILNTGVIQEDVSVSCDDMSLSFNISAGTKMLDADGNWLSGLTMEALTPLPESPDGYHILAAFNFQPDGATFDPGFELTMGYDPSLIPEGLSEEDLVIGIYNETTGEWTYLTGTVNAENNTITFTVTHFSIFAVMAASAGTAPAPTPTATATTTPEPTETVSPTPTATATPTEAPWVPAGGGTSGKSDLPDKWILIIFAVMGGLLLAGLIGAIAYRAKKA